MDFEPRHGLVKLVEAITHAGLDGMVDSNDTDWCHEFAALVADLAGNSIGARYARANADHRPIDDDWCCVNPELLFAATESFAIHYLAVAQAAEEAASTQP